MFWLCRFVGPREGSESARCNRAVAAPAAVGRTGLLQPEEHTFFPSNSARRASFHYGKNDTDHDDEDDDHDDDDNDDDDDGDGDDVDDDDKNLLFLKLVFPLRCVCGSAIIRSRRYSKSLVADAFIFHPFVFTLFVD